MVIRVCACCYNKPVMITYKHFCWTGIAIVHLLIAGLHAAHLEEWPLPKSWLLQRVMNYGDYTGAGNIFSFFAPGISNEIAVVYTIADAQSRQQVTRLEGTNTECNRRIRTIYNFFSIDEAQSLLAQSCASYMLRQHPDGTLVRVTVISRQVPAMPAYRQGAEPVWQPFFVKDYKKKDHS